VTIDEQKLVDRLKSHDLRALQKLAAANAPFSDRLLRSLTDMCEWRSRYPSPSRVDGFWFMSDDGRNALQPALPWPEAFTEIITGFGILDDELLTRTTD
jgi:hypothetical protein